MTALAEAFVSVRPDTSQFEPDLRRKLGRVDAARSGKAVAGRFGVGFNGAIGGIVARGAGIFAAGFAAVKIGGFLKGAISQASDLGETMSKSAAVFGPANRRIQAFAKTAGAAIGQSRQEATAAAAQFGNMFNQLGIGQKPAADMSIQMVKLASDFASFHNADITDVLEAQQAAFRGEYDSVQKFVPTINAAAVEQEGMRLKLAGSTKELTAQDKAVATHSLLLKGAGKAQGDFARTSEGMANQQRILTAQFDDFKAGLGEVLLPVVTKFFQFLNDKGIPILKEIGGGFKENVLPRLREFAGFVRDEVVPRLQNLGTYLAEKLGPVVKEFAETRLAALKKIIDDVKTAIQNNRPQLEQLGKTVQDVAKFVIEDLIPALSKLSGTTLPLLGTVIQSQINMLGLWVDAWNAIKTPIFNVIRFVIDHFLGMAGTILTAAEKMLGWTPGVGTKLKAAKAEFDAFARGVNASLDTIDDEAIKVALKYSATGVNLTAPSSVGRRARGGSIHGRGTETSDSIPTLLSNNEHVISAREVRGAGGHAAIEAMRAQWRGMATGGRVKFDINTDIPGEGPINKISKEIARQYGVALGRELLDTGASAGPPGAVQRFRGVLLNARTIRMLTSAEQILGHIFRIMQGSYSTRVAASGGTHSGGGAMDTDGPGGWNTAVRALRKVGFAAWHRTPAQGPWGHHIHSIAIGDPTASPSAKRQVQDFLRGGDGLGSLARVGGRVMSFDRGGFLMPGFTLAYNGTRKPEPVGAGAVSVSFTNCTFAGTSKAQFTDLVVGAIDKAKQKRRL